MDPLALTLVEIFVPIVFVIIGLGTLAWLGSTWLRMKHGYPLDGAWGQALNPNTDREAAERFKLLSSENAQLRAELGSVKDRLRTIERIITDGGLQTAEQIRALRDSERERID
jgi:hypothetical protein